MQSGPDPPQVSRTVIVALRIVLLVAAAGALAAGVFIGAGRHADVAREHYTCPMHPEVETTSPGQCPICFMALEPVTTLRTRST